MKSNDWFGDNMIKKCKVLTRNLEVMVVKYDDTEVQMPSDKSNSQFVFVKKDGNTYIIVTEAEFSTQVKRPKMNQKNTVKKEKFVEQDKNIIEE